MKITIILTVLSGCVLTLAHVHGFDLFYKILIGALCVAHIANIIRIILVRSYKNDTNRSEA